MTDSASIPSADKEELTERLAEIAVRSQSLISDFWQQHAQSLQTLPVDAESFDPGAHLDPLGLTKLFSEHFASLASNPQKLIAAQFDWWRSSVDLWEASMHELMGERSDPVIDTDASDKRFRDDAWSDEFIFSFAKQTYLIGSRFLHSLVNDDDDGRQAGVDVNADDSSGVGCMDRAERDKRKLAFFMRQYTDALSPSNFVATNPEVLAQVRESNGECLIDGLRNMLVDIERGLDQGTGSIKISQVDESAFELGKNVATTPGSVVFENELMQLIQYTPTTDTVYQRPILIVPPWINKYYILDLREDNSFIRWLVGEGHTVFVVSWVNPDASLAHMDFEDYMQLGPLAALDAIFKATGERQVNLIGYCIGGTLLAATLAWMEKYNDQRITSATFLTTLIDFSEPGDLGVFTSEEDIEHIESLMAETGYLDGASMANTFNMLRSSDLIWSFIVNNYLLGKPPLKFDLLFWNADSTRMPAAMHSFYLRNMYLNNLLCKKDGIQLCGQPINVADIKVPALFVATEEDHIAPWQSCFQGARLLGGDLTFVLSGSGHIAGIVNPPAKKKYYYLTGGDIRGAANASAWRESCERETGSWWPKWGEWISAYAGTKVAARNPGDHLLSVIEPAPGRYCLSK